MKKQTLGITLLLLAFSLSINATAQIIPKKSLMSLKYSDGICEEDINLAPCRIILHTVIDIIMNGSLNRLRNTNQY